MNPKKSSTSSPPDSFPDEGLGSALLSPDVAEGVIRLLCAGARLENRIPLSCYILEGDGEPRKLAQAHPDTYRNLFCNCANSLEKAALICNRWHEEVARACWESGPVFDTRAMVCPFGLSVMLAPVACRGTVKAVLFTGDWRESGGEGIIYHRLDQADIPMGEETALGKHIPATPGLFSREIDELKKALIGVVGDVSRIITLMYVREQIVRERALTQSIAEGISALPSRNLEEACAAAGGLLESIRMHVGVEYVILFTNVGVHDRLRVSAHCGLDKKIVEGLFVVGDPRQVAREASQWHIKTPEERRTWSESHLSRGERKSTPKILRMMEEMAPIELGAAYCGLLAFGPFQDNVEAQEPIMSLEDRHQLVDAARKAMRNGLRDMAERQQVAEILATFSHILRGPLMSLQGAVDVLRDHLASDEIDKALLEGIFEEIQNEVEDIDRQAELLEEANKTIRYQKREASFRQAQLASLVDKVSQGLRNRMKKERGIVFGSLKQVRGLPDVEFDWDQMRVVFANLIHNACKYAHYNSTVEFAGDRIKLDGKPAVRVGIRDFGTGIHPDEIDEQIWRPGFRGTIRDLKRDIIGTGMGLAVCKDIVEEIHQGRIWAECQERGGEPRTYQHCWVEFFVELPIEQPKSAGGQKSENPMDRGSGQPDQVSQISS